VTAVRGEGDAVASTETVGGRVGSPRTRVPRNYLAPSERRRLFWLVMPAALCLVAVLGWVERTWFARPGGGVTQVDTRLEAITGARPREDEVVIEREPEPLDAAPAAELSAALDSLARVRDATFFRVADEDAWFQTWNTLREAGLTGLRRGRPQDVGFGELFGQPRSYRGRLVRIKGTLHRLERLAAPANDYSIGDYWQGWLEPAGGPPSPVVVQCLTLPPGMPSGMHIHEPVEIIGYFFKNYAYSAADTIRVAPLVMSVEPVRRPLPARPSGGIVGPGGVTLVVAATLAAVAAATWLGVSRAAARPVARAVPAATGLDDSLAGLEPFSVEESLQRIAAARGGRETTRGAGEPDA
jgi:hypothetical protein